MTRAQFFEKVGAIAGEHRFDRDAPRAEIPVAVFDATCVLADAFDKWLAFETTEDETSFKKGVAT